MPRARGRVLEVGMGSGINLEFYNQDQVEMVYGLEPSEGMRRKALPNLGRSPVRVEWPDWHTALLQMKRVLKPGGDLLFLEHGEAPHDTTRKWQHRITPGWRKLAGGCHLNRHIAELIEHAGFDIQELENLYMPNAPKIAGYIYKGRATKPE